MGLWGSAEAENRKKPLALSGCRVKRKRCFHNHCSVTRPWGSVQEGAGASGRCCCESCYKAEERGDVPWTSLFSPPSCLPPLSPIHQTQLEPGDTGACRTQLSSQKNRVGKSREMDQWMQTGLGPTHSLLSIFSCKMIWISQMWEIWKHSLLQAVLPNTSL